jgi:hypothetical protein
MLLTTFAYCTVVSLRVFLFRTVLRGVSNHYAKTTPYIVLTVLGCMTICVAVETLGYPAVSPENFAVVQFAIEEQSMLNELVHLPWLRYPNVERGRSLTLGDGLLCLPKSHNLHNVPELEVLFV